MLECVAQEFGCKRVRLETESRLTASLSMRGQTVWIRVIQDTCELTSVVLQTRHATRQRELARLAWRRNSDTDLVTFAFDDQDRLVGRIRHPVETLDREELSLYVESLFRECDRFEYLLSGLNRNIHEQYKPICEQLAILRGSEYRQSWSAQIGPNSRLHTIYFGLDVFEIQFERKAPIYRLYALDHP